MRAVFEILNGIEVVNELPVIYLRKYKAVVLADTHIGFEEEMADKGVFIPRFQKKRLLGIIDEVTNAVDADTLVIAGDFKHKFDGLGRIERIELSEVLKYALSRFNKLIVVRGNHDNYLPLLTRKYRFEVVEYLLVGNILIIHGHNELPTNIKAEIVIMGHEHPTITLRDSLGSIGRFQCFLVGDLINSSKLITLPAVGAYQTGSRVTLDKSTYLSPILRDYVVLGDLKPIVVDEDVGILELPPIKEIYDFI